MKRFGLGVLLFAWLYGVPFLLVVGLIRRTSSPYTPTYEAAKAFGAATDALLTSALVLNAALPATGLLLAWLARERVWRRHFAGALVVMPAIYVATAMAAAAATAPLIGHVPSHPAPEVTRCIPVSGGHGCPGG
ncbi:MAG TPA: hypothetical protein VFR67_08770 [Pilimelia sp.]|nr:hypothetical protein [Pilimelia sp.]